MEGTVSDEIALALGKMYFEAEEGITRDLSKAKEYLEQAAHADYVEAIYLIGRLLDDQGDAEAYDWYHRAADKGSADAQNALAGYYLKKIG